MRPLALLAAVISVGVLPADDPKAKDPPADDTAILGTWEVEKYDGSPKVFPIKPLYGGMTLTFLSGDVAVIKLPGEKKGQEYTFKIDPTAAEKTIDFVKKDGTTMLGLYRLSDGALQMALTPPTAAKAKPVRPAKFVDAEDKTGAFGITFTRPKETAKPAKKDR